MAAAARRQRLKQKDLVAALFVLFSEEYDRIGADSIFDIELPLSGIRSRLRERIGVEYTSDAWIGAQIRKYEEEIGAALFARRGSPGQGAGLALARDIRAYSQKQHLYVTQKIKVANGVFDLVRNDAAEAPRSGPIALLLGAGSTVTRLAEVLAEEIPSLPWRWRIATHNIGVIQALARSGPLSERIEVFVPEGRIDPVTNIILGKNEELFGSIALDWAVQGASFLKDGGLYVESEEETAVKTAILSRASGRKILVLTGHEAVAELPAAMRSFGRIEDYDFVVIPRAVRNRSVRSRFDLAVGALSELIEPLILNWNYEIFRRRGASGGPR